MENEKVIWDSLKSRGLNDFAVAGIMGNLQAESNGKPTNLQNTYERSLGYTDESYTAAVDNGSYKNFVQDKAGYGLAQWTFYTRKQALLNYAKSRRASIGDLAMQLDFLWGELTGYTSMMKILKKATSVREASDAVLTQYEQPADQSESMKVKRASYGQAFYDKYAGKPEITKTVDDVAKEVIQGLWGNGAERKSRLTKAGYNYTEVQKRVDEMLTTSKKSIDEVATEVIRGVWGNGAERKKHLTAAGYDYKLVQARVDAMLK